MENEQKNFEEFKARFKTEFGIDIDYQSYKKIMADEFRAKQVQKEANELGLPGVSTEESNAKCVECSGGLSYVEHMLYGNRCVFCAVDLKEIGQRKYGGKDWSFDKGVYISLFVFLVRCFYDYMIYKALIQRLKKKGPEGRHDLLGCLGVLGYIDINQVKRVKDKMALLKELRRIKQ